MAACRSEKHFFSNLDRLQKHLKIFNKPYKFKQICLLSHENFCWPTNVNKAVYEHEKTANLQLADVTGSFQLPLHAANANSQRTVFMINMPPSFLLWWIASIISV